MRTGNVSPARNGAARRAEMAEIEPEIHSPRCTVKRIEVGADALMASVGVLRATEKRPSATSNLTRSSQRVALVLVGVVARHPCLTQFAKAGRVTSSDLGRGSV